MTPHDADPERNFQERFAALVQASGLSTRAVEKSTRIGRSTVNGWAHGKTLPQDHQDLIKVVEVLRAAATAIGNPGSWGTAGEWQSLLRRAKDARDARSTPTRRQVRDPAHDAHLGAERHARTIAATDRTIEALSGLHHLGDKPDWDRERRIWAGKDTGDLDAGQKAAVDAWEDRRQGFLQVIEVAILDIGDADLRERLKEAVLMLEHWESPMQHTRQSEGRTRYLTTMEALEAVGAFRRGDPLPERSADYLSTKQFAELDLELLELNAGHRVVRMRPASRRSAG